MAKTKGSRQVAARERARQARLRVDAEREKRDEKIEDAAAAYFAAADDYADIQDQLHAVENRMRSAANDLLALGESKSRVAALLDLEAKQLRRLLQTGTPQRATEHLNGDGERRESEAS